MTFSDKLTTKRLSILVHLLALEGSWEGKVSQSFLVTTSLYTKYYCTSRYVCMRGECISIIASSWELKISSFTSDRSVHCSMERAIFIAILYTGLLTTKPAAVLAK